MAGLNPFSRHMIVLRRDAGGLLEALVGLAVGVLFWVTLRYTIHEEEDMIAQPDLSEAKSAGG